MPKRRAWEASNKKDLEVREISTRAQRCSYEDRCARLNQRPSVLRVKKMQAGRQAGVGLTEPI